MKFRSSRISRDVSGSPGESAWQMKKCATLVNRSVAGFIAFVTLGKDCACQFEYLMDSVCHTFRSSYPFC